MKQHEEVFFSILRSALWKHPVQIPEGFKEWNKVMKLAVDQAMQGLVGDVILTTPDLLNCFPAKAVEKLQDIPLNSMAMHTTLNNTLILVMKTLRAAGIEPVLLKGQGIAQYYPIPQLRQCGDIDLYVGAENYEKAYEALLTIVTEIEERSKIWRYLHFHAHVGSVLLEIHHKVEHAFTDSTEKILRKYTDAGMNENLNRVKIGDVEVNTPEINYNACYIFFHLWRHYVAAGVGLRQISDLGCYLSSMKDKLDLNYLKSYLTDMNLMTPWQTFGCILVDKLGMPEESFPFYDRKALKRSEKLLDVILNEGNFGKSTAFVRIHKRSYLYEKFFSLKCHIERFVKMFSIFPRHSFEQIIYKFVIGFKQIFYDIRSK